MQTIQDQAPWSEADLSALRATVASQMSEKRFTHTAAVEDMVARLASLYCPEKTNILRAAALLHDITKECDVATQLELCRRASIPLAPDAAFCYKTLHAKTAAALIPDNYPAFAHETVLSAVRWHTTARAGMSLCDKLLFLADYIDDSRIFPDCVRLRSFFWNAHPERMDSSARADHLRETLILSFDMTIRQLVSEGAIISTDTTDARNELVLEGLMKTKNN